MQWWNWPATSWLPEPMFWVPRPQNLHDIVDAARLVLVALVRSQVGRDEAEGCAANVHLHRNAALTPKGRGR